MVHQPAFPSPYLTAIDVSSSGGNDFRCLINPRDTIIAYTINIHDAKSNDFICSVASKIVDGIQQKSYKTSVDSDSEVIIENIPYTDTRLPLAGSGDDKSWLQVNIPNGIGLINGHDYKWHVILTSTLFIATYFYPIFTTTQTNGLQTQSNIKLKKDTDSDTAFKAKYEGGDKYLVWGNEMRLVTGTARYANYDRIYIESAFTESIPSDTVLNVIQSEANEIRSFDYYFKARSTPMVDFDIDAVINTSSISIYGSYYQNENIGLTHYQFDLLLDDELIDSTGEIISSTIHYDYDGLLNGKSYVLRLTVLTLDGVTVEVIKNFTVEYETYQPLLNPTTEVLDTKGCVKLDFSIASTIDGKVEDDSDVLYATYKNPDGETPTETNAVSLNIGQNVYWSESGSKPLNLEDTTQIIHWHGHPSFQGVIFEKIDETNPARNVIVRYDGTNFYYKIGTSDEVSYCPCQETALGIIPYGATTPIDESTLYVIYDDYEIQDTDTLISNDITYNYWWFIIVSSDNVQFIKSAKYEETVVNTSV